MRTFRRAVAVIVAGMLAACGGDIALGPQPSTLESEMASPNPMAVGEIDDATGTMIP